MTQGRWGVILYGTLGQVNPVEGVWGVETNRAAGVATWDKARIEVE
jgi:hypothetical protein